MLGAGAPFQSAEETDLFVKALLAGIFVFETPRVSVVHYGARTFAQGASLIPGYILGRTAMYVKHFKCGHWSVIFPCLYLMWRWAFGKPVVRFGFFPSRWGRLQGFARGLLKGSITPVDRPSCRYISQRIG